MIRTDDILTGNRIGVLHVDSEFGWRGGQQQALYLFEAMHRKGFHTAMVCQHASAMESVLEQKDLPRHAVRMHGELDITAGYRIARICRVHGFDILHLHAAHALAVGLWARMFHRGLRIIGVRRVDFHIHRNLFSRLKYDNPWVDRIACISERIHQVLIEDGVPPAKLTVIRSGVDVDRFRDVQLPPGFRGTLGLPENRMIVGTVAALVGHKDYPNLLQAARRVLDRRKDICFCAVGDGPLEGEIHAQARSLGLGPPDFVFTGYRTDVGRLMKLFDLFVLASHLEGLGTSILDAQALGLPVVACRAGGIPEAVQDGVNGLLVPPGDPSALADAILALADDPGRRKALGSAGRQTVQRFSIEGTVNAYLDLYASLLKS